MLTLSSQNFLQEWQFWQISPTFSVKRHFNLGITLIIATSGVSKMNGNVLGQPKQGTHMNYGDLFPFSISFFFFPEISVFHSDLRNCLRFVTDFCVQEVISPWSSRKAQRSAWVREMCWKSGLEAMGSRRFSDHGDQLERWKSTLLSTCGFPD